MDAVFGDVLVVIAREMTKIYEEFLRGSPKELMAHFKAKSPRGEMVVLFNLRMRAGVPLNEQTAMPEMCARGSSPR